ncbi:hypothetical protein BDD12DRAFT_817916 [Trichophaea hybrida]|nr:hypothetical protein BDD12DRAFT_817916 [Trichophaea hybrida]
MHAVTVITFALAAVSAIAAQQQECDAQNILDACSEQYKPRLDACKGNDWECFCTESTNLLTCYNVCPNADKSGVQNQVTSYCGAYSASLPSSSKAATPSKTGSASSSKSTSDSTSTSSDTSKSDTSAAASASTSGKTGDGCLVTPAKSFGVVAGLLAVAGMFL